MTESECLNRFSLLCIYSIGNTFLLNKFAPHLLHCGVREYVVKTTRRRQRILRTGFYFHRNENLVTEDYFYEEIIVHL